jgi:hypothetical protein
LLNRKCKIIDGYPAQKFDQGVFNPKSSVFPILPHPDQLLRGEAQRLGLLKQLLQHGRR